MRRRAFACEPRRATCQQGQERQTHAVAARQPVVSARRTRGDVGIGRWPAVSDPPKQRQQLRVQDSAKQPGPQNLSGICRPPRTPDLTSHSSAWYCLLPCDCGATATQPCYGDAADPGVLSPQLVAPRRALRLGGCAAAAPPQRAGRARSATRWHRRSPSAWIVRGCTGAPQCTAVSCWCAALSC